MRAAGAVTDVAPGAASERWDAFGFDPAWYERWTAFCSRYRRWLSTEATGLENVPSDGPVLLVGNHAGLRLHDAMCLQAVLHRDHPARRVVRPLFHIGLEKNLVFQHMLGQYAGGVIGHPHNARYLLDRGFAVLTYPEGAHTTSKPFARRDRLCPPEQFGRGWARLAVSTGVPVVPVAAAGFESAVPTVHLSAALGRYWLSNADFYPVSPQSLVTLTLPFLNWVAPFPVRTRLDFGAARDPAQVPGADDEQRADLLWDDVYADLSDRLAVLRHRRPRRGRSALR